MKNARSHFIWLSALMGALEFTAPAQVQPFDTSSARSFTGQFIVRSQQQISRGPDFSQDPRLLKLEPSLLTVTCERVKQALATELGPSGEWRGKIYLSLHPAQTADEEIAFIAERFRNSWVYRLELPNPVERTRLVRAIVQALLLEQANRGAGERSAEIPWWLVEGLARQVLGAHGADVLLPPPQLAENRLLLERTVFNARRTNAVTLAQLALGKRGPVSLEELSWPKPDQLAGAGAETYGLSAQLFVGELLRFEDGRDCLRAMLGELPKFLNWQMAFLRGFKLHFERQLDVEKWWALQTEYLTGRNENGLWSPAESWAKLDAMLRAPVQVRREKKDLPSAAEVPLTTVIREWEVTQQTQTLRAKLAELDGARLRVAADFLPLVDEYRRVVADYLSRREQAGLVFPGGKNQLPTARTLVRETLRQLEALEAQRQKLKPQAATPVAGLTPGTAANRVK